MIEVQPIVDLEPNYLMAGLEPGDIILSTVLTNPISFAIRSATKSNFSHAAICWNATSCMEAVDHGITSFSHLNRAINDKDSVRILRLKPGTLENYAIRESAANAATTYMGREYWLRGAIQSKLGLTLSDPRGRLFCSYLVAQAYADIGIELCVGKISQLVTPQNLLMSPMLHDITDEVLYPVTDRQKENMDLLILDGIAPEGHQNAGAKIVSDILTQARPVFSELGYLPPSDIMNIMAQIVDDQDIHRQKIADKILSKIIFKSGWVGFDAKNISAAMLQNGLAASDIWLTTLPDEELTATILGHDMMLDKWEKNQQERKKLVKTAKIHSTYKNIDVYKLIINDMHLTAQTMAPLIRELAREIKRMKSHQSERYV